MSESDVPRWPIRVSLREFQEDMERRRAWAEPDDDPVALSEQRYVDIIKGLSPEESRAVRSPEDREKWDRAVEWIAEVRARGGMIDFNMD